MTTELHQEVVTATGAGQESWPWPTQPDPGDLSRRLGARRAELRLSIAQVAERARVTERYLEYLENFPAQPGAVTLRRLAAALLGPGGLGRIAFAPASGLVVLPTNYVMVAAAIVLRTGTGSLIAAHGDGPVSFEVDHLDEALGQGWSVLVRGQAHRVLQRGELGRLRGGCELEPWPAGEHDLYIKIIPDRVTGRRIRTQ